MNSENKSNHQSDWETCVVCGNSVEPGRGAARLNHRGNTINLCGPACRETFAQEPDPYLARLAKRMRELVLRESAGFGGPEGGPEQDFHPAASRQVMGAKRDLVKCAAIALLFGSIFVASATRTLSADISTNLTAGGLTNAAVQLQTSHPQGTAAPQSLSSVPLSPLSPGTSVTNLFDQRPPGQIARVLDWCAKGSSNLLTHTAVACCPQPLREGINWSTEGLTKAASGARQTPSA